MQSTLILLKPDCVKKSLCGKVINRFEKDGFKIKRIKNIDLSDEIIDEHYAHVSHLPFFPDIKAFMQETEVIAIELERENAVARAREIIGPTDSALAPKGSIRGDYGENKSRNIVHASDSPENAAIELKRFFG